MKKNIQIIELKINIHLKTVYVNDYRQLQSYIPDFKAGKVFFDESDVRDREFASVQTVKYTRVGIERENDPIGTQKLALLAESPSVAFRTVLAVA